MEKLSIDLVNVDQIFGVLLAASAPHSDRKNCWYWRSNLLVQSRNKISDLQPECLLHKCLLSSIAHESRPRSAQLVSPPPTVLRASEIQQEGGFPRSAKRVAGEASNTLPVA